MTTSDQSNSGIFEKDVGVRMSENAKKKIREAAEKNIRRKASKMYESPIQIIYDQMRTQIDDEIIRAVQSYNITIDRDELIKALEYDRHQYEKGFADAQRKYINGDMISREALKKAFIERLDEGFFTYSEVMTYIDDAPAVDTGSEEHQEEGKITENKGDLISRKALKKKLTPIKLYDGVYCKAITEKDIDDAPTVEQKYYERIIAQINPVIEVRPHGEEDHQE